MNVFRNALEYYQNDKYSVSNILIYLKYYTYFQKLLFEHLNLTPSKIRKLSPSEIYEYSKVLFPNVNLADFGFLVNRLGKNRIIDKHTKRDVMQDIIDYFTNYTVPFMDIPQYTNNFIKESDVAQHLSNRFDEPKSFNTVMNVLEKYGDRTIFHEFLLDHIRQYQEKNKGKLPPSYSRSNIKKYLKSINNRLETDPNFLVADKTYQVLLTLMRSNGMIDEMNKIPSMYKNYYLTEAILDLEQNKIDDFYSSKVKTLFKTDSEKASPLYTL